MPAMTHAYTELLAQQCDTSRHRVQHWGATGTPRTGGKEQKEATGSAGALSHWVFSSAQLRCLPAYLAVNYTSTVENRQ